MMMTMIPLLLLIRISLTIFFIAAAAAAFTTASAVAVPGFVSVFEPPPFLHSNSRRRRRIRQPQPLVIAPLYAVTRTETTSPSSSSSSSSSSSVGGDGQPRTRRRQQQQPRTTARNQQKQQQQPQNKPRNRRQQQQVSIDKQIVRLGRKGWTDEALDLFHSIRPYPNVRQLNAAIDVCARARPVRLQTALSLFDTYCGGSGSGEEEGETDQPDQQGDGRRQRRHLTPNVYTYGALMHAVGRAGNIDLALELLNSMEEERVADDDKNSAAAVVRPNAVVYQSAISAAAHAEPVARPDIALDLLERARHRLTGSSDNGLTVVGYNAAIYALSRTADWKGALQLLETMQNDPTCPHPDQVTYGTVMAACEQAGEWEQVLELCQKLKQDDKDLLPLDGMAITSALHACQQLGLAEEAVEYLNLMKTMGGNINNDDGGSSSKSSSNHRNGDGRRTAGRQRIGTRQPLRGPDAVAYRLAISACARGGAWEEGIRLLQKYESAHPDKAPQDVVAYTAAITGCEYAGEWERAIRLLKRLKSNGTDPNVVTFAAVLGACATACARLVQDQKRTTGGKKQSEAVSPLLPPHTMAMRILNVLRKDESVIKPNLQVYNVAIRVCAEALDVDGAFELLGALREDGHEPSIVTYGTLMLAAERTGSMNGLSKVFGLMKEDELQPNEIIYGAALSCCRKAGEPERAFLLLKKMIQDGLEPNVATINTVLMAQTDAKTLLSKDIEQAVKVFKLVDAKDFTAASPNRQTYSILIRALAANGRPNEAEAVLRTMREADLIPDVDLYTATVTSYEQVGHPLKALRLMEAMREDGYDFYEVGLLNAAFKKVVKLANAVGQTWTESPSKLNEATIALFRNETGTADVKINE